jgi:non-homologous end joining protein Ku
VAPCLLESHLACHCSHARSSFPAISSVKVRFHLINRKPDRIKYLKIDAETGEQVGPKTL